MQAVLASVSDSDFDKITAALDEAAPSAACELPEPESFALAAATAAHVPEPYQHLNAEDVACIVRGTSQVLGLCIKTSKINDMT